MIIQRAEFIICSICKEKYHYTCQKLTDETYRNMDLESLDSFKCIQCNTSIKDLSIGELNHPFIPEQQHVDMSNRKSQIIASSPETLLKSINTTSTGIECSTLEQGLPEEIIDKSNVRLHKTPLIKNSHKVLNNQSEMVIKTNDQTDPITNKLAKPVQTKKITKPTKQEDTKSKLAVAEAHIARLESTITNNNNLIRNLKLQNLGNPMR